MPANSKRIAKNTVMLYIRMLLMMAVTLYTSRVILQVLGVDDYGIYHLVAGFVTMFSFISRALVTAMQRFFNVALGKGDKVYFQNLFSTSINIFILLSIIVIVVGETVGVWFVNTQLNIPEDRIDAAKWVFQLSLLVFIAEIMRTPYNAAIIAHEKMGFYAFVSIFEALLKLGIVFLLQLFVFDKLILYAMLFLTSIIITNLFFHLFCRREFAECRYRFIWDKQLFVELFSFSGWSLMGQMATVGRSQGESYLINHYHSVAINAAQGVSGQLLNAMHKFVSNFQTAFNPQLVQTYAAGEMQEHTKLLCRACKFSYFLFLLFVVPVVFNIDVLLSTWLTEVPAYSKEFCVLGLCSYLIMALGNPLITSVFAQGKIRNYQISLAIAQILGLILSFIVLKQGYVPYSIAIVSIMVQVIMFFVRLYYNNKVSHIGVKQFFTNIVLPVLIVTPLSLVLPAFLTRFGSNIWLSLTMCAIDACWVMIIVFFVGFSKMERKIIKGIITNKLNRGKNK